MQGEILLNLVMVLTPDDVRRMEAAGLGDLAKKHIDGLDKLAAGWRRECGPIDSEVLAEVQARLNELRDELRDALRDG
ncbi:hypothetical protein ES703_73836 [subsurface metagenome]